MVGGLLRGDGRDREDAAGRALLQLRQAEVHEANEGLEHQLERLLERVRCHVRAAARRRATGVPDEDIQAAERLERLRDGALEIARERHVAADGERADPVRLALEHVAPAGEHRDVRALGRERLGGGEAQAGRGAADECRPAFQSQVHRGGTIDG